MSEAEQADGPLAFESAVGLLSAEPVADDPPVEVAEPEDEIEAVDQTVEDAPEPEEVAGEVEQEPEPVDPVIEAPHFWSQERKADFAKLPPELQAYVLEQDKAAQRTVSQKQEAAAKARKEAETQAKALSELTGRITEAATVAETAFANRWNGMTDQAWLDLSQADPAQYTKLRARFDAEQGALQRAKTAREAAEAVEYNAWLNDQSEQLKTVAPELADPEKGQAKMREVASYLQQIGVPEQAFERMGAFEWSIAHKAKLWDDAQASLAKRPAPKPAAAQPVKSTAAAVVASPKSQALETAKRRLGQTGDVDDAVALLRLQRKTG